MSEVLSKYLIEHHPDFHWDIYKALNKDLLFSKQIDYELHYLLYGISEKRKWQIQDLLPDFDWTVYKRLNPTLVSHIENRKDYELHYLLHGIHKKLPYNTNYNAPNQIKDNVYKQLDYTNNLEIQKNILVIIPGFGEPNLESKMKILERNIEILTKSLCKTIQIRILIFLYSIDKFNYLSSYFNKSSIPITIIAKKGIIGEFIYKYVDSKLIAPFNYLLFLLDDVEIHPYFNMKNVIKIYTRNEIDILGFPLTLESPTTHSFMYVKEDYNRQNMPLLKVNFIELFCYFMCTKVFHRYKKLFNELTYWLWGIDLILYPSGFKLYRLENLPIKHYFCKTKYKNLPDANIELNFIKSRYPFITDKVVLSAHPI